MAEFEFAGKTFAVREVGIMPIMRFAHVAQAGVDSASMEGLDAVYQLLEAVIVPEDWARFQQVATRALSSNVDMLNAATAALQVISDRPTLPLSDSSDGPAPESGSSPGDSSLRVIHELEQEGRPSIAVMVKERQSWRDSA